MEDKSRSEDQTIKNAYKGINRACFMASSVFTSYPTAFNNKGSKNENFLANKCIHHLMEWFHFFVKFNILFNSIIKQFKGVKL